MEENYRDFLHPDTNCVPHYYKGHMDLLSRLTELQDVASTMAEKEELQDSINFVESCEEQGYAPLALVELYGAAVNFGIRFNVDLGNARVHRESVYAYNTNFYGKVYEMIDWIVCRSTDRKDAHGLDIYETPAGVKFVVATKAGSPEYLGNTSVDVPRE